MGWIDDWGKFLNSKGQLILKKKFHIISPSAHKHKKLKFNNEIFT